MVYQIRRFGWVPDLPDARDHLYAAPAPVLRALPASVDLRPQFKTKPYDQGQLGSCTGNAIAGAIQFERQKQNLHPDFIPSRLFIYYNERVIEGTVGTDAGAQIRDGIKSVVHQGACTEKTWPYTITKFARKPPAKAYAEAAKSKVASYSRLVPTLSQLKGCLASGYPFVFGFTVYESFEGDAVARTGEVPMPAPSEAAVGGHAVLAMGYDDAVGRFLVRNSWGTEWGKAGHFTMPYAYLTDSNLSDDFWTIRLMAE
jgi:C1A family cysteine protease